MRSTTGRRSIQPGVTTPLPSSRVWYQSSTSEAGSASWGLARRLLRRRRGGRGIRDRLEGGDVGRPLVLGLDVGDRGRVDVDGRVTPRPLELREATSGQLLGNLVRGVADGHLLSVCKEDPGRHAADPNPRRPLEGSL